MKDNQTRNLLPRPPIVVVMGHVDHGKTTLLDYIRKTNVAGREAGLPRLAHFRSVAESEAGGITQSIGAYEIIHANKKITFIDTPGHEAFSQMRSRGADVADLAILAVAADEGVRPQTKESAKILEQSRTPFIVAITKIDKNNADEERVKNELTANGILLEGYGGQISWQSVSAKTGKGVNELLDLILLASELEHLTYDKDTSASGYVLEAKLDRQRGLAATLIIKNGILRFGDFLATPTTKGKVKILENFLGEKVGELTPSSPALVIGFENLPQVGEEFSSVNELPEMESKEVPKIEVAAPAEGENRALRLILKAVDSGSLEALSGIIKSLGQPVKILNESVGDVSDNDVKLAIPAKGVPDASKAVIIAFKSRVEKTSKALAEANNITVISSEIIYELLKTIEKFLQELEKPKPLAVLKILAVFNQSNPQKQIVGGRVEADVFKNKATFEIERDGNIIGSGRTLNLQQDKKDVSEVSEGKEAGLLVNSGTLLKVGDNLLIKNKPKI